MFKCHGLRNVVTLALTLMFLYNVGNSFTKYEEKDTLMAQSMKSASDVVYPSITLCPMYKLEYMRSKVSGSKNLTEYYEKLKNMSLIRKDVLYISQPYRSNNG